MNNSLRLLAAGILLALGPVLPLEAAPPQTVPLTSAETPLFVPDQVSAAAKTTGEKTDSTDAGKKTVTSIGRQGQTETDKPDSVNKHQASNDKKEQAQKKSQQTNHMTMPKVPETGATSEPDEEIVVEDPPVLRPLTANDFTFNGLHAGDSLQQVKRIFGSPTKYSQSAHYTELKYNRKDLVMTVRLRNDTPQILKESAEGRKAVRPGVDSITLAAGPDVYIGPGIHLGHPAELLIRKYGRPLNILRDADADVYYFVYENPRQDHVLIFAIGNRKVARVALMPPRPPYIEGRPLIQSGNWTPRDFTLVGYGVNEPFTANKYNMWTNMVRHDENKFWLYGTYGVEVDRHNTVKKVFLLTNNSYTGRGITLGYRLSTLEAIYGKPDRIEKGPDGNQYVDAYYYDSPFQQGVSLVFISKHENECIDDILLISEPIKNIQDPMERYGLK